MSSADNLKDEYNKQNIIFNHNPNSFFYMSAKKSNDMPSENDCKNLDPHYNSNEWIEKCNSANFPTNHVDCMKIAYCKNYERVKELYGKRNDYSASGQMYIDKNEDYKREYTRLISLSTGILVFGYLTVSKIFSYIN
jgi:hypothetical protein